MEKAIIYGAGTTGKSVLEQIQKKGANCIAFIDNDSNLHGEKVNGISVIAPNDIVTLNFDKIYIGTIMDNELLKQLLISMGVNESKIDDSLVSLSYKARIAFLKSQAEILRAREVVGSCAECGVLSGSFAKVINETFFDRTLYLFDTFEGFDQRDIGMELSHGFSNSLAGTFGGLTSVDVVMSSMPFPEKVVIKKGYFPETTEGIEDTFVFVNLDFDLYKPTLAGLNFFYPKLAVGGILLIHDYFSIRFKGAKQAVDEFCENNNLIPISIGDTSSVLIVKNF
ncbi:TylF/MycF/NovP-related O-methyltransferase [Paenibacillus xylanexedens]|uniref:TylF/MycF/NovP-related O-methyltransferase n=1 Tax=Paenibacillus xylanexedens TaxID=528191 RepID=UPI0011A92399|nr:TylF/MycF/NovP-related O-methyltransferase [Paenibacillus xylanexedens]